MPVLTPAELEAFIAESFPSAPPPIRVESVGDRTIRVRKLFEPTDLRPGGTLSGPALMTMADLVGYLLVAAAKGRVFLAVTTSLHIDFLRKPRPTDVVAEGTLVKLGKRLAVASVELRTAGEDEPVAIASVTYSLPSQAKNDRSAG